MSETKFTPGPWNVGMCSGGTVFARSLCVAANNEHIQECVKGSASATICLVAPEVCMTEVDEANAELIADAPELLKSLREMYDVFHRVGIGAKINTFTRAAELLRKHGG